MLWFGITAHPVQATLMAVTSVIGIIGVAVGVEGYMFANTSKLERLLAIVGGICLLIPGWKTDTAGTIMLGILLSSQLAKRRLRKEAMA
jgi:TRAP-type uncharacterized transport system fused permease subunit